MFSNNPNNHTMDQLLECFQECRRKGEVAQLFLETRGYRQFATFSVQLPPNGFPDPATFNHRNGSNGFQNRNKPKSPSRLRRDQFRLRNLRAKQVSKNSTTPSLTPSNSSQNKEDNQLTSTPNKIKDREEVTSHTTEVKDLEEVTSRKTEVKDLEELTSHTTENKENPDNVTLDSTGISLHNIEVSKDVDYIKENSFKEKLEDKVKTNLPPDFHDLLKNINNQIKDISKHYRPVNKDLDKTPSKIDSEEHAFEDAAVWARNQKKISK